MSPDEKLKRLSAIGKHAALIKQRYGFSDDPRLRATLSDVRAALRERAKEILGE